MPADSLSEIDRYNIRQVRPQPDRCALLVIDMQHYFLSMAAPILENVLSIIDVCRSKGIWTIFTQHGHKNVATEDGMLAQWWGDLIEYGSKNWELINLLKPSARDRIINKNQYSAFHGTGLDESLRSRNIEELIITGVMTNCCCETTARDAFVKDFRVFFISDATATVNDELHLASLKNLAFGFSYIISTQQLCGHLSDKP
ncbi:MAG: isochorismatase family protein [Desulfobacterales bacterium]|nr:MAG: isochorismatase family protein [Desulfobacterales bacterium]